ncbi:restriction endonuclease subunit S [Oribacterium sp. FC2011]|uniref:restriction endonuclease subunit S n=1 Tax=Oribacterium sp. FC2011 TaxID=1408311 RepID=UPI0004E13ACF|nr:restriction endonuclease subunit S [Oribacterium sp. FC2011]
MRVKLEEVCKRIYAGGDVPKDRYSEVITDEYSIPIYANAEKDEGLYGYTDEAREKELSITVAARGTIGYTAIRRTPFLPVVRLITVVPDLSKVSERYLFYALKNCKPQSSGTSIPQLTVPDIKKNRINLLDINEQELIADRLDKLNEIIKLRKEELFKLDELIQARFVELFGDPIHNEMGWDTAAVESVCKEIFGGGTPSKSHPEYYENGDIPWVSSKDMKTDVLTESQIYINQKGVDNSTARMVPVNSVIMVIRSGILKHTLPVAINAVPITVNQDLKVFIPGESMLTRFMAVQFKMQEADILSGVRAVTADNIEFNSLKQRAMIVPPIELQKEYVDFLEQVDKSKVAVQKSLDETQKLFDSLMQEYFG